MANLDYHAKIEAMLFAHGEPMQAERLAQLLDISLPAFTQQIEQMQANYEQPGRGLMLLRLSNCYQLCTKPAYRELVQQALAQGRNQPISAAAMEVLAIIAYNQPVSKGFIEQVRGVDSAGSVGNLLAKGLIEEAGRLDLPGRPVSYRTSVHFLRCFGLKHLTDLPPIEP